ncbi:DUF4349 domain-containing protein [Streptomyces sp. 3MP-14]|uniref:DUF4349 domain-containing protein n=2 Tax=Streptomyces TaxID=1883 RepID=A0A5N6AJU1_9ACTN|nr:DUF4349 domain-containing protein [Streptomyces mimosae]KAB8177514.1 DUF4349 domain-containing protein [Streptomyces sp. 3MP-14]
MRLMRRGNRGGRRRAPALALAALLAGGALLAGCTSSGMGDESGGDAANEASAEFDGTEDAEGGLPSEDATREGAEGEAGAEDSADLSTVAEVPDPSQLIQTATLTVAVESVPESYAEAVRLTQAAGGYVSDESTTGGEDEPYSTLTLRVPKEGYAGLLGDLAELGELSSRELTTEDVGDQIVDTESRLETQRESIDRVRDLMEEATTLDEIVRLESELSTRQAELESLEARLEALRGQTAMATVTLELYREGEPAPQPVEEEDERPSVLDALLGGVEFVWLVLVWIAIAVGAALPVVALLAVLWLLWRLLRPRLPLDRLRTSRPVPPPPVAAPPPLPRPAHAPEAPDAAGRSTPENGS